MPVRNPDMIRAEIRRLHDIHGLSYREINELAPFSTIPAGTICAIANGYPIPNKHRPALGLQPLVNVPADRVKKHPPQPPRKLTRCTIYRTTPVDKILDDLERVTGKRFMLCDDNTPDDGTIVARKVT